jgi:uncharacterized protein with PIN domain
MNTQAEVEGAAMVGWFENHYRCPECNTEWMGDWSCMCNDRCPECNSEIEPMHSVDLSRPLAHEHFAGAARLLGCTSISIERVTADDARNYAEAVLEGGEHRFVARLKACPSGL